LDKDPIGNVLPTTAVGHEQPLRLPARANVRADPYDGLVA